MKTPEKKQNSILLENLSIYHFSGFYNTIWTDTTDLYFEDEDEDEEQNGGAFEIDYQAYKKDISENFFKEYLFYFNDLFIKDVVKLEYSGIWSPKYYNFETDEILYNLTILDIERFKSDLLKLIAENFQAIDKFIFDRFTSRDGFISFYSNSLNDWIDDIKNNLFDSVQIAYLIGFLIDIKHEDISDIYNTIEMDILEKLTSNGYNIGSYIVEVKKAV